MIDQLGKKGNSEECCASELAIGGSTRMAGPGITRMMVASTRKEKNVPMDMASHTKRVSLVFGNTPLKYDPCTSRVVLSIEVSGLWVGTLSTTTGESSIKNYRPSCCIDSCSGKFKLGN